MNVQVASQVAKQLRTYNLRELGHFQKIPEMPGFDGKHPVNHPKSKF